VPLRGTGRAGHGGLDASQLARKSANRLSLRDGKAARLVAIGIASARSRRSASRRA
jgi:hypothetical protein